MNRPMQAAIVPNESVNSYADLSAAIGRAPTDGTLYAIEITGDIPNYGSSLTIASGKNVFIASDANGPWTLTKSATGFHFTVFGTLTLENIELNGNWSGTSSSTFGGVAVGTSSTRGGVLHLNEGAVIRNCHTNNAAEGGGITCVNGGTVIVNGGTIRDNTKTGTNGGGGLYVNGAESSLTVNSGAITGNRATSNSSGHGGGISATTSSAVTINGGVISDNTAALNGGGVSCGIGVAFTMTGGTISGNQSLSIGPTGGPSSTLGGGLFAGNGPFNMTGGTISNNILPRGNGGGICINSTTAADARTILISGATISGNETTASGNGGGIYVNLSSTANVMISIGGSTISDNESAGNGGGVYVTSSSTARAIITVSQSEIVGNVTSGSGGGIYGSSFSTIEVHDSNIGNNRSNASNSTSNGGGGIFGFTSSQIIVIGSMISGNATTSCGGGIYGATGSQTAIGGGRISGNAAASYGGGIFGFANSQITVSGGAIIGGDDMSEGNTAGNGGGICAFGGTGGAAHAAIDGATVGHNAASANGGGVYLSGTSANISTLIMASGAIIGNTAQNGGGIYVPALASLQVTGAAFITNNSAPVGTGGGIYSGSASYSNLDTGSHTVFSGNAAPAASVPPANAEVVYPHIQFAGASLPNHPLNNYDINFIA